MPLPHETAQVALTEAYGEISRFLGTLEPTDLARPSRCAGWLVSDVLFHVLLDAQRALVALSTPAKTSPTVDFVSYWRNFMTARTDESAMIGARYVRIAASAYPTPQALAQDWHETSGAVLNVVGYANGNARIATQGHVMTVTDFFATLAVEATIHHLDMLLDLAGKPIPKPNPMDLTVRTLDALMGNRERPMWDDPLFVLKATGRDPLTIAEQRTLGNLASMFPLIG